MLMVRDQTELNTPSFVSYTNFSKHLAFFFTPPPLAPPVHFWAGPRELTPFSMATSSHFLSPWQVFGFELSVCDYGWAVLQYVDCFQAVRLRRSPCWSQRTHPWASVWWGWRMRRRESWGSMSRTSSLLALLQSKSCCFLGETFTLCTLEGFHAQTHTQIVDGRVTRQHS